MLRTLRERGRIKSETLCQILISSTRGAEHCGLVALKVGKGEGLREQVSAFVVGARVDDRVATGVDELAYLTERAHQIHSNTEIYSAGIYPVKYLS